MRQLQKITAKDLKEPVLVVKLGPGTRVPVGIILPVKQNSRSGSKEKKEN